MSENNENIPLDEMMRSLKKGANQKRSSKIEGGERVVRADGSEAIKVKSKKRRTVQPKKEIEKKSNKRKVIFIAAAIGLILISVIGFSVLLGYFNGNRFKSKVNDTIANVTGATVELGKLDVSPASAKLTKVDLRWSGENSLVRSLKVEDINADYGVLAFVGGGWGGSAVGVARAELNLEMGKSNPRLNTKAERPLDFKFGLYQCSLLNVNFGEDSLWSFKNGSISYRVSQENDGQFSIDSGDLVIPSFGVFEVSNGLVNCELDGAQIYLGLESQEHHGIINVDGTTGYAEGSPIDLKVVLQNYSLREWVDPRVRRFLRGKIVSGEGTLKMKVGDVDSFNISTDLTTGVIAVSDFEFLKTVASLLEDDFYPNPRFDNQSKMTMKRTKRKIEFTKIDLIQDGQMRIKGEFTVDESNLMTGSFRVGLPVVLLSTKIGKELKSVFNDDDGEYIWAEVNLSGDVSLPKDDLDEQFKEVAIKSGSQVPMFEQKFEELTR
ncbi:MAG: hypothetical protein ACSHX6_17190 [Akkermansiaceae bacterium]